MYSTLQLNIENPHYDIIDYYIKGIIDTRDLLYSRDLPQYGNDINPFHITIKNGIHTKHTDEISNIIQDIEIIQVEIGKTSIFSNGEYDILKFDIYSEDLININKIIRNNISCTDMYLTYNPHITLAYLKEGKGNKYKDDNVLHGLKLSFNKMFFYGYDKRRVVIPFNDKKNCS